MRKWVPHIVVTATVKAWAVVVYFVVTRPDQLQWAQGLLHEVATVGAGMMFGAMACWLAPVRWADIYDSKLPAHVRAGVAIALGLLFIGPTLGASIF